jgi:Lrp/AsnC family leucine-responsive transcriptional regulator
MGNLPTMAFDIARELDGLDWAILRELQANARITFSELGRRVSLSAPAVAERVRRMEEAGVVTGYRVELNLERLGFPLLAFIRVRVSPLTKDALEKDLQRRAEVLECHQVTGEDCYIVKLAARSVRDLQETVGALGQHGATTTSLALSCPVPHRALGPSADRRAESVAAS